MLLTGDRDTLSFVAVVADVADVAHVTFVIGINLSRELPEHGRKGQYCHGRKIALTIQPKISIFS